MKKDIIHNTLKIFAVGGVATLLSAAAGACAAAAGKLLCSIPSFGGYLAVGAFAIAIIAAATALGMVYFCGAWIIQKGHFTK